MIPHIEKPINSNKQKTTTNRTNKWIQQIAVYKINIQKLVVILYINSIIIIEEKSIILVIGIIFHLPDLNKVSMAVVSLTATEALIWQVPATHAICRCEAGISYKVTEEQLLAKRHLLFLCMICWLCGITIASKMAQAMINKNCNMYSLLSNCPYPIWNALLYLMLERAFSQNSSEVYWLQQRCMVPPRNNLRSEAR